MENLRIEQGPNSCIEIDVREDGSAWVLVEDFAGSIDSPSQSASIHLSPDDAARVSKALARE